MKKTIVINLFGGPGIGKSTIAAKVFTELKNLGISTELVLDYIKKKVESGHKPDAFTQPQIYGEQLKKESALYNQVEFIITNSPLLLSAIHQLKNEGHDTIKHQIFHDIRTAKKQNIHHINLVLCRSLPFFPDVSYEYEKESIEIDQSIHSFLNKNEIDFEIISAPIEDTSERIIEYITEYMEKPNNFDH